MLVKGSPPTSWADGGSILLLQLGDIGDVVLNTPSVRALKENFANNRLLVCVREKARELMEDFPWCDEVVSVDKRQRPLAEAVRYHRRFFSRIRRRRPCLAVDLRTGTRGAAIALLSGARLRLGRFAEDGGLWRNRVFTHLVRPEPQQEQGQYVPEHALNILLPMGLVVSSRRPELAVTERRRRRVRQLLARAGIKAEKPPLAVHPFSLWTYKEWRPGQWASLIDHVAGRHGLQVLITGSAEERKRAAAVADACGGTVANLAGMTAIGDLPALFSCCRGFVGVDTAALHIAAAVKTPTLGIFGPSSPVSWAPRGKMHETVANPLACVPCRQKGCENTERSRCLDELDFTQVRPRLDRWLAKDLVLHAAGASGIENRICKGDDHGH